MSNEVKKIEKHWFMICKQQQKIEANILVLLITPFSCSFLAKPHPCLFILQLS